MSIEQLLIGTLLGPVPHLSGLRTRVPELRTRVFKTRVSKTRVLGTRVLELTFSELAFCRTRVLVFAFLTLWPKLHVLSKYGAGLWLSGVWVLESASV